MEKGNTLAFNGKSENTKLMSELHKQSNDTIVTKYTIGSFYKTELEKELKGIKEIVVSGILTNLCVRSLVSDAYDRSFEITIIEDCCVAVNNETHRFTLKDLKTTREEMNIEKSKDFIC